jgi:hypothetical protein
VIVNQTFVKRYFAGLSPLGRRFKYKSTPREPETSGFVVIGVVGDIKYNSLRDAVAPTTYAPSVGHGVTFPLRTAGSPTALMAAVREAVRQTDPNLPIIGISTQAETIDRLLRSGAHHCSVGRLYRASGASARLHGFVRIALARSGHPHA